MGEATAPIEPWPHQVQAFKRMYDNWPPKLLIADEVGLGKTIQAGLLLRQAWLAGKAKRILILAPKAVLNQWQIELREKFSLHWPIYDGKRLIWYSNRQLSRKSESIVDRSAWHKEPVVLASSHLMRRRDRAEDVLESAQAWDLIVLDEAHHARRRGAGSWKEGGPNNLLSLMRGLKKKCRGLVLLTATPMQVAPVEVWDLLSLLGLPEEWTEQAFLKFFEDAGKPSPSPGTRSKHVKDVSVIGALLWGIRNCRCLPHCRTVQIENQFIVTSATRPCQDPHTTSWYRRETGCSAAHARQYADPLAHIPAYA